MDARLAGQLAAWPSIHRMAAILQDAGLDVQLGRYSIRILDCSHFVFHEYGGDLGEPVIDADADTLEELTRDARLVSDALTRAEIRHRFEIYAAADALSAYLHYDWPLEKSRDKQHKRREGL
jgi:hypothetical protein